MPRPGPRPYECVRRAWHSERHQPMRGLIIQQIFRLVHDNHSAATKKNREWLEKLPIVVFKAEEIIYSKANSEAEYSNAETLWDRVNDAVDTLIRKDESTETGELLPPCIEAALNLGCVQVRSSRSQRLNTPRTSLRPAYQGCSSSPMLQNDNPLNVDSPYLVWDCSRRDTTNTNQHPDIGNRGSSIAVENNTPLNRASVYPLYYGMSFESNVCFQEVSKSDPIFVGVPIFLSGESAESRRLHNLFPCGQGRNITEEICNPAPIENEGKQPQTGFDLSLRLGRFSDSNREKGSSCRIAHK